MKGRLYALNATTGTLLWRTDPRRHPFAMVTSAPKLDRGRLYVPVSSAEELAGAHPKYPCCTFRTVWSTRIGQGGPLGGVEFGAAADARNVYVPPSDWSPDPKTGGGSLPSTSQPAGKSGPRPPPRCLSLPGCSASQQAPATLIPGVVFAASLDGHIRASDATDGRLLWSGLSRT